MDRRKVLTTAAAVLFAGTLGTSVANAQAQAWPTRTVKFILTLGPGSTTRQ